MRLSSKFTCSINEWYFARIYMNLGMVEGEVKALEKQKLKQLLIRFLMIFVTVFIQGSVAKLTGNYLQKPLSTIINIFFVALIPFAIYVFFKKLIEVNNVRESLLNPPDLRDRLQLYKVDEKGIVINYNNDHNYLDFLKWGHVQTAELIETEFAKHYHHTDESEQTIERSKRKSLKATFADTRKIYPSFSYEEEMKPSNSLSIDISMKNGRYNTLPIPPSWEKDGQAAEFIRILKDKLDNKFLEPKDSNGIDLFDYVVDFFTRGFGKKTKTPQDDRENMG